MLLTEAVYIRPSILTGRDALIGFDYFQLHALRISFAQDALFGSQHHLPSWYPHEFLGAPFSANLQSFPWIPTRLVLLFIDPVVAYTWGIAIAAALSAVFAYLYCRRVGLSELGAAIAAWTFACAGFFSSRVEAGQLGFLEAYASLPLMLWLADRAITGDGRKRDLLMLAIASACIALAGHPQLPAYSLAIALLYVAVRGRGWMRFRAMLSIVLGVGMTLFAWWPMLLLVRQSTRMLHLAPPGNDIPMAYGRLLALIVPGIDGWADGVVGSEQKPFVGYSNLSYFWDTASYMGLLPLAAIAFLFVQIVIRKRLPRGRWLFIAAIGVGAFVFALPGADLIARMVPGTLLRSPARLLYVSTFAAAAGLGCVVDIFLTSRIVTLRARQIVIACLLVFHAVDVVGFARRFIQTMPRTSDSPPFEKILSREVKDARIASEGAPAAYGNRYDDVGIFDSILMARPYRVIMSLNGTPSDNEELIEGSELAVAALQAAGARFVVTSEERSDLKQVSQSEDDFLYEVPDPAPRASFYEDRMVDFMADEKIVDAYIARHQSGRLLLPANTEHSRALVSEVTAVPSSIAYHRPSSDEIRLDVVSGEHGFANVLEAYDPGWRAEVDGQAVSVIVANGFSMAVPVPAGSHVIRLHYYTPGRFMGALLSLVSAVLLASLIFFKVRRNDPGIIEESTTVGA